MRHVLPIIERELRVRARRPLTRWTRLGVTAAAILLVTMYVASWSLYRSPGQNGMAFQILAWTAFMMALAATFLTVDAISSERREGTLGLLFLTELSGLEVAAGKISAALITGVYVFIGFAPVLMLALLPGGVTGGEVARVTLVLVATLLVTLTLGIWVSARHEDGLSAVREAAVCLFALLTIPWLLEGFVGTIRLATGISQLGGWVSLFSPIATFRLAGDVAYQANPGRFWLSLAFQTGEAMFLLAGAGRTLAGNWREGLQQNPLPGAAPSRLARRGMQPSDEANPIGWLVRRQRGERAMFWIAGLILVLFNSDLARQLALRLVTGGALIPSLYTMLSALSLVSCATAFALCGLAAGRFFLEARASGELELLRSTPQGARQMLWGQWRALKGMLIGPSLLFLLSFPITAFMLFLTLFGVGAPLPLVHSLSQLLDPVEALLDMWAATWLGLWFGLRCRNVWSLMAWTTGLLLGVSMVFSSTLWILVALLGTPAISGSSLNSTAMLWLVIRPALQLAAPLVMILWARHRLMHHEALPTRSSTTAHAAAAA